MGARLCRHHLRDATRGPSARPLLPERDRGTGEPDERDPRPLGVGSPLPGVARPVTGCGARDVHVGMRVSRRAVTGASSADTGARRDVAVLVSGGLDSAVLVAELLR